MIHYSLQLAPFSMPYNSRNMRTYDRYAYDGEGAARLQRQDTDMLQVIRESGI